MEGRNKIARLLARTDLSDSLRNSLTGLCWEADNHGHEVAEVVTFEAGTISKEAYVDYGAPIDPRASILGKCVITSRVTVKGECVISDSRIGSTTNTSIEDSAISGSTIYGGSVSSSQVKDSGFETTTVAGSDVEGSRVAYSTISNSTLRGANIYGQATIEGSTVEGTVGAPITPTRIGTLRRGKKKVDRYIEKATPRITDSVIGKEASVIASRVSRSRIGAGVSIDFAEVRDCTITGSARVRGVYKIGETKASMNRSRYEDADYEATDQMSLVSGVTLTREYIGPAASVLGPTHVSAKTSGGALYTRYRSSEMTRLGRRKWGYTKVTMNSSGYNYEVLGFDGDENAQEAAGLFE